MVLGLLLARAGVEVTVLEKHAGFLNLLAKAGMREPAYTLHMRTATTELIREAGRVRGVRYRTQEGTVGEIRADLTVACDGRWSIAHRQANLPLKEFPLPVDAWWFRLPRRPEDDPSALVPRAGEGRFALVIPREGFLQLAYIARSSSRDGAWARRSRY